MKILRSKWFSVLMILAIGWLGLSFIKIKLHSDIVNKEVVELDQKVSNLEKSNNTLQKFIALMTDPGFLEKQARLELNYKAPGEEVVFVYPDTSAKAGSQSLDFQDQLAQMPNYLKWLYYLLGY